MTTPKEQAIALMATYNTTKAALMEACAKEESEIAILTAALEKARAPLVAKMEHLKAEVEQLGQANLVAIFGPHTCQLVSNGHALKKNVGRSVVVVDEEQLIELLLQEAGQSHLLQPDAAAEAPTTADLAAPPQPKTAEEKLAELSRIAARACLRIKVELNKEYVQSLYKAHQAWFNERGIFLHESVSVTLSAVPTKKPKAKAKKSVSSTTETPAMEEQAA